MTIEANTIKSETINATTINAQTINANGGITPPPTGNWIDGDAYIDSDPWID